jgi:agmatinase
MTTYHNSAFGLFTAPFSTDMDAADAVLLGAAFDLGTCGRAGTREGPQGVRNISNQLMWESNRWPWKFNLKEHLRLIDYGDIKCEPGMADEFIADLSFHVKKFSMRTRCC